MNFTPADTTSQFMVILLEPKLERVTRSQIGAGDIYQTVLECSECGQQHTGLLFKPVTVFRGATHAGVCPKTKRPIFVNVPSDQ